MKILSVLGKSGTGKTLAATHFASALAYFGFKTLLIGTGAKKDAARCYSSKIPFSVYEQLEKNQFSYLETSPNSFLLPVNDYLDVLEMGPSPLIVGDYGTVISESMAVVREHKLFSKYDWVVWDVTDSNHGSAFREVFRASRYLFVMTDDSIESLFEVNRIIRAFQIARFEYNDGCELTGLLPNKVRDDHFIKKFTEASGLMTFSQLPFDPVIAGLRKTHRTLFDIEQKTPAQKEYLDVFLRIIELLIRDPFALKTINPLRDDQIWKWQ